MNDEKTTLCNEAACGCAPLLPRRDFLLAAAAGSLAVLTSRPPVMAGPFVREDFEKLVPIDKKLDPKWVASLFARGTPTVYRGADLKYIGMPVGGICAGQVYLGGDGQLWHWDIFNRTQRTPGDGDHYGQPITRQAALDQGFVLRVDGQERPLDAAGFADVSFCGQYPIGRVEYRDKDCPVEVSLKAFSPFIPLNVDDSSLPATVMRFTIKNLGAGEAESELVGRLENAIGSSQAQNGEGVRFLRPHRESALLFLEYGQQLGPNQQPSEAHPDFGSMSLALLEPGPGDAASDPVDAPAGTKIVGSLARKLVLKPGESATATFVITWHFPNLIMGPAESMRGRYYATRFDTAASVARYVAANFDRLYGLTKLWCETWYEQSTLPHWLLERTLANASILATSTCVRFAGGRFYAHEGVGCCPGTCTHVWMYEQTMGRLFPELDRVLREMVDYGVAFNETTGGVGMRGEDPKTGLPTEPAIDGQAGIILRTYRAHQHSTNRAFLQRNWPRIKMAMQYLIRLDENEDGIIEGAQPNTLDTAWYGPVAWLSGLYLASLRAAAEMASEVEDARFANECRSLADAGRTKIVNELFNGEYFINRPDPRHPEAINSGSGCEIDQVFGQSWAFQVGLDRVLPERETISALRSLWRYNFSPDVGPYRERYPAGRWYALAGEAGLLMCTFPRSDWDYEQAAGHDKGGFAGYFNECMNGFEHQVASHMLWENMVQEGLAIERAVHDRYHAARRNPWNEIECGDHYARSMASYGVFIAACGFQHDGPKGYLAFAPRLTPNDFAAAFTAADGWGRWWQKFDANKWESSLVVRCGSLHLKTLAVAWPRVDLESVRVVQTNRRLPATATRDGEQLRITLDELAMLTAGDELRITAVQA